jgi:hypothetical protein
LRIQAVGFAAAVVLGVAWLPGAARAGALAELTLHKGNLNARPSMELCVGVSRSANCRSTIETALRAATSGGTPRGALYEALTSATPSHQMTSPAGEDRELGVRSLALKFNEDPEWKKRAKVMARDGLPFMRLPQSGNRELLVGITPHGLLGFSLRDKAD